jgi:hypothetical protein
MPQICAMGQTALLSLRRKACCGFFFRQKNPTAICPVRAGMLNPLAPNGPTQYIKMCQKKKIEALQYCYTNEFIELTVGTSRVLMSKAATNSNCSNKHKA